MLYLEDYLEMIEHLPQELRDRFTEMRELDLTVQNNMDSLEKKTRAFFMQCKRGELQDEAADSEYQNLRKEYYKVLEDADEKVTIATQIHELVERYLRRLDSELFKFKCELEADNNGITEILEKRSLEMDGGSSAATALLSVTGLNQKENRYYGGLGAAVAPSSSSSHNAVMGGAGLGMGGITVPATPTGATKDNRYRTPKPEKRRDSTSTLQNAVPEKRANLGNSLTPAGTPPVAVVRPITPSIGAVLNAAAGSVGTPSPVTYNLQQIGGSATTAIAAAATQAIVATQQMQQGRRSASMKASYEAIHGAGGGPTEFWISRDISNPTATASALGLASNSTEKSKKKYTSKKLNSNLSHNISTPNTTTAASAGALSLASSSSSLSVDSVDMLAASAPTSLNVPSLIPAGQHVTASSNSSLAAASSSSAAGSSRQALSSTSSTASASTSSSTSTALTPGSNITLNENGMVVEQTPDGEWSYDPNEPRYCTCNQVSYGDMVACDNDACPYEWFHYPCVGITQPPKGKWYCPKCTASMRRRGNRKN